MRAQLATAMAWLALSAAGAAAQSVRVTASSVIRYIELRPFVRDSVAADTAAGSGLLRQLADGRVVRCIPGEAYCHDTRPGARMSTVPLLTDVEVSAWGLGEGVRLFGHVRGRSDLGDHPELWPRGDHAVEVLAAYAEIERARLRVRAGRQWTVSGLGFYNFDGITVGVRPHATAAIDAYVGRSLLRGLNEQRTAGVLESIEALAPRSAGLLVGVQARYRPGARLSLGTTYQVDFRDDGAGLYSELVATDAVLRLGAATVDAAVEFDVAASALNEARLRWRGAPIGRFAPFAEVRRYRPYFELWTIWGAFSPVGFDELQLGATWAEPDTHIVVRADGSYRRYGDTHTDLASDPMRDDGWSVRAAASWSPHAQWRVDAGYRVETGAGAARRDGHAGVQLQLADVGSIALQALAFQRLYEFRLNEGTVVGFGAETSFRLSQRARISGNAAVYRHLQAGSLPVLDWTQRRGSVRLQWTFGPEAGAGRLP